MSIYGLRIVCMSLEYFQFDTPFDHRLIDFRNEIDYFLVWTVRIYVSRLKNVPWLVLFTVKL